jgi:hypothetical protein
MAPCSKSLPLQTEDAGIAIQGLLSNYQVKAGLIMLAKAFPFAETTHLICEVALVGFRERTYYLAI